MTRETIYTIGRRNFEKQQVGQKLNIHLKAEERNPLGFFNGDYYEVLFGVDTNGRRYMALATEERDGHWHGAHKSGGHWHGSGFSSYTKGYAVKLRKNFKDAEEANHYYNIVKANMYCRTVEDDENENRKFTEAQIDKFFS